MASELSGVKKKKNSQRGNPAEIPRPQGRRAGHLARAVRCGWRARIHGTECGRYQCDPGRVGARLPLDGRLVGIWRGQVLRASCRPCGVCGRARTLRSGAETHDKEQMTIFSFLFALFIPF
jgi:hypothetical protein